MFSLIFEFVDVIILGARLNRKHCSCFCMILQLFFIRDFFILHFCLFFTDFWGRWRYIALARLIIKFFIQKKKKTPIFLMLIVKFCIFFVFKYGFLISRTFFVKIWRPTIECEFVWRWGWYCGRRRARIDWGRIGTPYGSAYSSKVLSGDGGWKLEKRKKSADCK